MGEQHFNFLAQPSRGAAAGDKRLPVDGGGMREKIKYIARLRLLPLLNSYRLDLII
jgi:hypothetical protein